MDLNSNKSRASFVAGLNAVYKHLKLCGQTVHCKNSEPVQCSDHLPDVMGSPKKVFLVGYQPRFLAILAKQNCVRVIDLDKENIGKNRSGVIIEPPHATNDILNWCDLVLATGSTIVNGSITHFLNQNKPVLFYGVTISAAAKILDLNKYCYCGH
jgi:uncharacterized protein (DUF4213/DUF364 family)